jgi:hypothetical protein
MASVGFDGVFDTQGAAFIPEDLGSVEVRNLTSSFEITDSGSKGTIPPLGSLLECFCG